MDTDQTLRPVSAESITSDNFDPSRLVFHINSSKDIRGHQDGRYVRVLIRYADANLPLVDHPLIIETGKIRSYGVKECPTTIRDRSSYSMCLRFNKDDPCVLILNTVEAEVKKYIIDHMDDLRGVVQHKTKLKFELENTASFFYKPKDIVRSTNKSLYTKLLTKYQRGDRPEVMTNFFDIHGNMVDARSLLDRKCQVIAALTIDNVFISSSGIVSMQTRLNDAIVFDIEQTSLLCL